MYVTKGSKIGIHTISPYKAIDFVKQVKSRGFAFTVVKAVDNAGVALDVKKYSPETITITRFTNDRWDSVQGIENWDSFMMELVAKECIALILKRANAEERQAADYFEILNEADPPGVLGWSRFGQFLIKLILEAEKSNIKLALPGFNRGTPEWNEMRAFVDSGVFGYIKKGQHVLSIHEGTFNLPLGATYGDSIPDAPITANAGSQNFRYRYLYSLLKERNEVVPLVISEYYPGAPITVPASEIAERMAWYDGKLAEDYYVLGVTLFTIDPNSTWQKENYTYAYPEIMNYMEAVKNRANAIEEKMVTIRPGIFLNLRDGPSVVTGKVITTLYPNSKFPILEEKDGWLRVTSTGWISGNALYVIKA